MSEERADYKTEVEDALQMLGVGYGDEPAVIIEKPRKDVALHEDGLKEYKVWGWVKKSAKFIYHVRRLRGAKLSIWEIIALSIDENGESAMSLKELVTLTGYSRSEVSESLKELEEMGYLTVQKETGKKSIFKPSFAARGENSPSEEPVQFLDGLTRPVSTQGYPSSSPEENIVPSIIRVKRVKQTPKISGIEAAMFQDRKVEESDLYAQEPALLAFERDMQLPASWEWYPAKQTKEREWRLLRDFVIKTYADDPKAFEKYNTWRNQPFVKGAKSNTQIKEYPADFEVSWSDYLRANPQSSQTTDRTSMLRTL